MQPVKRRSYRLRCYFYVSVADGDWRGSRVCTGPDSGICRWPACFNLKQWADGSTSYSLSLQILALMTALTILPSLVLGMTSFTRIIIVLSILRQAMGTQQTPPNQVW